jgi:hypothetical protein
MVVQEIRLDVEYADAQSIQFPSARPHVVALHRQLEVRFGREVLALSLVKSAWGR